MADNKLVKLPEAGLHAATVISRHNLKVARPLLWHIGMQHGGEVRGASSFILRFADGCVGVTANHVVDAFLAAKAADNRILCQLGGCEFDLENALIARSDSLDIATFRVEEHQLPAIDAHVLDCTTIWPPPEVEEGDTISLTGYLDNQRVKLGRQAYELNAWGAHGTVNGLSETDIVTIYDPAIDMQVDASIAKPDLGFNMSGCSGGPVIQMKDFNGFMRLSVVGMIYKGPGDKAEGEFAAFDRIHARRLHFIQPDGSINEPNSGWLP